MALPLLNLPTALAGQVSNMLVQHSAFLQQTDRAKLEPGQPTLTCLKTSILTIMQPPCPPGWEKDTSYINFSWPV